MDWLLAYWHLNLTQSPYIMAVPLTLTPFQSLTNMETIFMKKVKSVASIVYLAAEVNGCSTFSEQSLWGQRFGDRCGNRALGTASSFSVNKRPFVWSRHVCVCCVCVCVRACTGTLLLSRVWLSATLWTVANQTHLPSGFFTCWAIRETQSHMW